MKFLAFILALIVLGLSTGICYMEDNCYNELTKDQNDNQHDDQCSSDCCSPFMTCKTCVGFVITDLVFSTEKDIIIHKTNYNIVLESKTVHSCAKIWNPPKLHLV